MIDDKSLSSRLNLPIGKKVEKVRRLRGLTQEDVGRELGISKQAYSKVEQSESIPESRLEKIASVLGVTLEGLKSFQDDLILNNTNHFHEAVTNSTINNGYENTTHVNHHPVEKIVELYEALLKLEREKVEILKSQIK